MRRLVYLHVLGLALAGFGSPAKAAEPVVDSSAAARKLYLSKCAKCHKLYDPARYTDAQWELWMGKMTKKARLDDQQRRQLVNYIENNFRHPPAQPANASVQVERGYGLQP
jgi:mono/diheme cytochrome c family protein